MNVNKYCNIILSFRDFDSFRASECHYFLSTVHSNPIASICKQGGEKDTAKQCD